MSIKRDLKLSGEGARFLVPFPFILCWWSEFYRQIIFKKALVVCRYYLCGEQKWEHICQKAADYSL